MLINGISSLVFGVGNGGYGDINVRGSSYNIILGDYGSLHATLLPVVAAGYVYASYSNNGSVGNDGRSITTIISSSRSIVLGGGASDNIRVNGGISARICGDDCNWSSSGELSSTLLLSSIGVMIIYHLMVHHHRIIIIYYHAL
jgi:hypothetical protein